MSLSPPTPLMLPEDLLYEMAETMLCTKQTKDCKKIDLRRVNGYTNFMLSNRIAAKVFFAQFVKMKHIDFSGSDSHPIEMYRSEEKSINSDGDEFYGPYIVPKGFVGALINYGKLRVKSVTTLTYLEKNLPATIKIEKASAESKKCKSSIQSFCKLFLGKELPDDEASNLCFDLDTLYICEPKSLLASNFDELLNLNAKDISMLLLKTELFDCKLFNRTMQAGKVEKLSLTMFPVCHDSKSMDMTMLHWESFVDFLLDTCPKIRKISIEISYRIVDGFSSAEQAMAILSHFCEMVHNFTDQLFPTLSKGVPGMRILANLKLCLPEHYEILALANFNLFKMGKEVVPDLDGEKGLQG